MTVQRNALGHWIKGQSGNPGGAPAVVKEVQELARQHTVEAIETLCEIMRNKEAPAQARVAAASAVLDRGYGKPPQALTDADGQGLVIKVMQFGALDEDKPGEEVEHVH